MGTFDSLFKMGADTHVNEMFEVIHWRLRGTFLEFYSMEEDKDTCRSGPAARRSVSLDTAYSLVNDLCKSTPRGIAFPLVHRQGNDTMLPKGDNFNNTNTKTQSFIEEETPTSFVAELDPNSDDFCIQPPSYAKNSRHAKRRKSKGSEHTGIQEKTATTVMIRHIACRYMQDEAANFLDEVGLRGKYDFMYLPLNPTKRANLGYMFVNFLKPEYVNECRQLLTGRAFGATNTSKRCEVTLAHVQGYANISRHFHRKAVMNGRHAPLFVHNGSEPTTLAVTDQ